MAMFDLEDTDDVNLKRCKTDGEQLLRGRRLGEVTVEDCESSGGMDSQKTRSIWRRALSCIASNAVSITVGVVVVVLGALAVKYLSLQ